MENDLNINEKKKKKTLISVLRLHFFQIFKSIHMICFISWVMYFWKFNKKKSCSNFQLKSHSKKYSYSNSDLNAFGPIIQIKPIIFSCVHMLSDSMAHVPSNAYTFATFLKAYNAFVLLKFYPYRILCSKISIE